MTKAAPRLSRSTTTALLAGLLTAAALGITTEPLTALLAAATHTLTGTP